jgi:hypothetical protein
LLEETVANVSSDYRSTQSKLAIFGTCLSRLGCFVNLVLPLSLTTMASNVDGDEAEFSTKEIEEIHQDLLSGSSSE